MSSLYMGSFRLRFSISFCFSLFALRSIPSYFTLDFLPANFASPSSLSPSIFWTLQRFCYLFVFRTPLSIVYVAARRHSPSLLSPSPSALNSRISYLNIMIPIARPRLGRQSSSTLSPSLCLRTVASLSFGNVASALFFFSPFANVLTIQVTALIPRTPRSTIRIDVVRALQCECSQSPCLALEHLAQKLSCLICESFRPYRSDCEFRLGWKR